MPSTAFELPPEQLQEMRAIVAGFGFCPDGVTAEGSEVRADLGPMVRLVTVHGLPAEGRYSLATAWLDELRRDLAAGLYQRE